MNHNDLTSPSVAVVKSGPARLVVKMAMAITQLKGLAKGLFLGSEWHLNRVVITLTDTARLKARINYTK